MSEPVSPVVLKSLMRSMGILSDSERFSARVKKSTVFLLPCSFQKLRQDLKASLRESNCFISPGEMYDKENSTLTGLPGSQPCVEGILAYLPCEGTAGRAFESLYPGFSDTAQRAEIVAGKVPVDAHYLNS